MTHGEYVTDPESQTGKWCGWGLSQSNLEPEAISVVLYVWNRFCEKWYI